MTKKQLYETPEAEVLVVKIESNLLTGSPNGVHSTNQTEYFGRGDDEDVDVL